MKTFHIFFLIATLLLVIAIPVNQCQAACWCGIEYCIGWNDQLKVDDSKTKVRVEEENEYILDVDNGSITGSGHTHTPKGGSVAGTTVTNFQWTVSGTLDYSYFGVSAKVGSQVTHTYGTDCKCEVNNWCQCCYLRAFERYRYTYKEGLCWCISPLCIFGSKYSGENREFLGVTCTDKPKCVVEPGCRVTWVGE